MTYKPKQLNLTGKRGGPKKTAASNDEYIKEHYSGTSGLPKRPAKPTLPKITLPGGLTRQKTPAPSGKGEIFSYSTPGNKVYEDKKWNPTNKKGGTKITSKSLKTKDYGNTKNFDKTIKGIMAKSKKAKKGEAPKKVGPVLGKSKPKDYTESLKQFGTINTPELMAAKSRRNDYQVESIPKKALQGIQKEQNKKLPIHKVPKTMAQLARERLSKAGTGKKAPSIEMTPKYGKIKSS